MTFRAMRQVTCLIIVAVFGATGCERLEGLWEVELDDSASAMSGRWEVASVRAAEPGCDELEAREPWSGSYVQVEIVGASASDRPKDADPDASGGVARERLDVSVCDADGCGPFADPYSRLEKRPELGWQMDHLRVSRASDVDFPVPDCRVGRTRAELIPVDGKRARLAWRRFEEVWPLEGDASCNHELAARRAEQLSCSREFVLMLRRPQVDDS